jgi:hypothetical protein
MSKQNPTQYVWRRYPRSIPELLGALDMQHSLIAQNLKAFRRKKKRERRLQARVAELEAGCALVVQILDDEYGEDADSAREALFRLQSGRVPLDSRAVQSAVARWQERQIRRSLETMRQQGHEEARW